MKVINLDQFKASTKVALAGSEHNVYGITVGQFIEGIIQHIEQEKDPVAQTRMMMDVLLNMTDIPEDVLKSCTFSQLNALIQVAQGVDPTQGDQPQDPQMEEAQASE